jgi:hypothetical protein
MRALYEDDHPDIVIEKAAQVGVSEWMVSWALHHLDQGRHVLYVLPTEDDVSDFSASRFGTAIEASPYLSSRVVQGHERGADRVTLKRIGDGFLFLRGGKIKSGPATGGEEKASQLKSIPADCAVSDEYDEIDPRADAFIVERMKAIGSYGHRARVSTPTYPGSGIHPLYMASDMHVWHVQCPGCNDWQSLTLEKLVTEWDDLERPQHWNTDGAGEPALWCSKCHHPLDRGAEGMWIPTYPGRATRGRLISRLFMPERPLQEILDGLAQTDESKRKQIFNQAMGLPYRSRGAQSLTDEILDACKRDYGHGPQTGGAFAGIDVGRVLHVVIRGADWTQRAAFEHADFDNDLADRLREHGVLVTVIDGEPETRAARAFQASHADQPIWLADYPGSGLPNDVEPVRWDTDRMLVKADRTRILDSTLALFRRGAKREAGGATLPATARDIPNYYAHLKAPVRQLVRDSKGNSIAVYHEAGADHYAHAEAYTLIAAMWWLNTRENSTKVVYNPVRMGGY